MGRIGAALCAWFALLSSGACGRISFVSFPPDASVGPDVQADGFSVDASESTVDTGTDPGIDRGFDAGIDAGVDTGSDPSADMRTDAGVDAGIDAGADTGIDTDVDPGIDAGADPGIDAGVDTGIDAGVDTGPPIGGPPGVFAGDALRRFTIVPMPDGRGLIHGRFSGMISGPGFELTSRGGEDALVAVIDAAGNVSSVIHIGGAGNDIVSDVAFAAPNHIYVSGSFAGPVDFGDGPRASVSLHDGFVAEYDLAGALAWVRTFGGAEGPSPFPPDDGGDDLTLDASGNLYLCGTMAGTYDFGLGPVTNTSGVRGVLVASFTNTGATRWARVFSAAAYNNGLSISVAAGRVSVTGFYEGSINFGLGGLPFGGLQDTFVATFDAAMGATLWARGFGGPSRDWGTWLVHGADGNLYLVGFAESAVDYGLGPIVYEASSEGVLVSFDPSTGSTRWVATFTGPTCSDPSTIVAVTTGIVVSGSYSQMVTARDAFGATFALSSSPVAGYLAAFRFDGALTSFEGGSTARPRVARRADDELWFSGPRNATLLCSSHGSGSLPPPDYVDFGVLPFTPP